MANERSDASKMWPNLPSAVRPIVDSGPRKSLAQEIFPSRVKPPPNPRRDATLRHLDQAIAKIRGLRR
jgi:hypothetical protein